MPCLDYMQIFKENFPPVVVSYSCWISELFKSKNNSLTPDLITDIHGIASKKEE